MGEWLLLLPLVDVAGGILPGVENGGGGGAGPRKLPLPPLLLLLLFTPPKEYCFGDGTLLF